MDAIISCLVDQILEKVEEVSSKSNLEHAKKFFAFFRHEPYKFNKK